MMTTKYHGIDRDPEISLFEYGLLVSNEPNDEEQYTCIYLQWYTDKKEPMYGVTRIAERQLVEDGLPDSAGFLDFIGTEWSEWDSNEFVWKLSDLLQYYGAANILGYDYYPFNKEQVIDFLKTEEMKVTKVLSQRLTELKRDIEKALLDMLIAKGLTFSTGIVTLSMGDNPIVLYNDGMSGAATIGHLRVANARSIRVIVDTDFREDTLSIEELDPLTVIKLIEQIENEEYEIV